MAERDDPATPTPDDQSLGDTIKRRAERKQRARARPPRSAWFGLGMFGLVGWSVVVPTLIGVAVGLWLDSRWPGRPSWTLTLLIIGAALGCLNAWYWITSERDDD